MMALDAFGGVHDRNTFPSTNRFRVVQRGPRYLLATPIGGAFWLKACYGVDTTDGGPAFVKALHEKYRHHPSYPTWGYWFAFVEQAVRYLRHFGFNTLGEYSSNYVLPTQSANRGRANSEKMPFITLVNAANYSKQRYGVKELMYGVDTEVTPGLWRVEGFPDVFDPAFARAVRELIPHSNSPWILGTSMDDRDYLFGFGPTREYGGWHNHLGWLVLATRPTQTANPRIWVGDKKGVTYSDPTVYSKLALRDFLRQKYGMISQLNAAWGAQYTTWESDGKPWPTGSGFLDESGRHSWVGKDFYLARDAKPLVRSDLDEFVGILADHYFSVVSTTLRSHRPGNLVFGPATLSPNAHSAILSAAGRWCDVVQFSNDGESAFRRGYNLVKKPFFVWTTFMAQADSPFSGKQGWRGVDNSTQEGRGRAYAAFIETLLKFKADDGTYPCVGIDWWAYCDKVTGGEANNFGLVSTRDNPYDGKAARVAKSTDAWGNPVGGEDRDFGDFLSAVKQSNDGVYDSIARLDASATRNLTPMLSSVALGYAATLSPTTRRAFLSFALGPWRRHAKG
jgi:hypothetical protein